MIIRKTGYYNKAIAGGEMVESFIPFPLPPQDPELVIDDEMKALLAQAEQKLMELKAVSEVIPSLDWFIYAYVRKESVTSSQIEGTQATLADLLSFEAEADSHKNENPHIEEICNYLSAMKYARRELNSETGLPISMRFLAELHKKLMKGVRGARKQPGEIRQTQNWIGGSRPSQAVFVPPPPSQLAKLLSEFEKYIHTKDTIPPLIRIGLLHVQFETIHPYLDGNGRIGRILITLLLEHWGLLQEPLLYLSLYLKQNREKYYHLLGQVRAAGEWEAWVRFFLVGVEKTAQEAINFIQHLSKIVQKDRAKLLAEDSASIFTFRLLELLPEHPIVTTSKVTELLETSKPTALKAIGTLEKLGILKENTGKKRDRSFVYWNYVNQLKAGTELKVYRVVINYAHEDFMIKEKKLEYSLEENYDFFYESLPEAKKDFKKLGKNLKNIPSLRALLLQKRDHLSDAWRLVEEQALWSESKKRTFLSQNNDVVEDRLQSLQRILEKHLGV